MDKESNIKSPDSILSPSTPFTPYSIDKETKISTPATMDTPLPEQSTMINYGYSGLDVEDHQTSLSDIDEDDKEWKCDDDDNDSNYDVESSRRTSTCSSIPFLDLIFGVEDMAEDVLLAKHGYKKVGVINDTMQGQLYKGQILNEPYGFVAIKKCEKVVFKGNIAIQDGMSFVVSEDIIKEAIILQHLTVDNGPLGNYIIKYIDFFQSDDAYYLVMEYIESEMNLKQFVNLCFKFIQEKKMKLKHYQKIIKYVYWQLLVTVRWLHHDMSCCHLDLCLENVMLTKCNYTRDKDGLFIINPEIAIKLGDFGVAEVFDNTYFKCHKQELSLDNESQLAPEILRDDGSYNGKKADIWSLGMILFQCFTGKQLYDANDMFTESENCTDSEDTQSPQKFPNGYWSLNNGKLRQYLKSNDLLKYFKSKSVSLLCHLLDTDPSKRYDANDMIKDKWFSLYYKTYNKRIWKKSISQMQALLKQSDKMANFPYYQSPNDAQK